MEEFTTLARTVPPVLLLMLGRDNASKRAARLLDVAIRKLDERTAAAELDANLIRDTVAELAALEDAGRIVDRLRGGLAAVGAAFVLYSWSGRADLTHLDGPLYETWEDQLDDAIDRADQALLSIDVAKNLIAESLDFQAAHLASGAADEVRLLRRDLVKLFFDAWKACR